MSRRQILQVWRSHQDQQENEAAPPPPEREPEVQTEDKKEIKRLQLELEMKDKLFQERLRQFAISKGKIKQTIYVGNIPSETAKKDIYDLFISYGDIFYINYYQAGAYMSVTFEYVESVASALKMNGREWRGTRLKVVTAEFKGDLVSVPPPPSTATPSSSATLSVPATPPPATLPHSPTPPPPTTRSYSRPPPSSVPSRSLPASTPIIPSAPPSVPSPSPQKNVQHLSPSQGPLHSQTRFTRSQKRIHRRCRTRQYRRQLLSQLSFVPPSSSTTHPGPEGEPQAPSHEDQGEIGPVEKERQIYVKNIPSGVTAEDIFYLFISCGSIIKVELEFLSATSMNVTFERVDSIASALKMDGMDFRGSSLKVFRPSRYGPSSQNDVPAQHLVPVRNQYSVPTNFPAHP